MFSIKYIMYFVSPSKNPNGELTKGCVLRVLIRVTCGRLTLSV